MTKALLVLPMLVAACTDHPGFAEDDPTTPIETSPVARAGDAPIVIATGGTQGFAIDDPTSVGFDGVASDGYEVEPASRVWPNMREPLYYVRALGAGLGSFEIFTNHGIASGLVESADLASVSLVPADYQLDGSSPFAVDLGRRQIVVELRDAGGRRLVDATLGIPVEQTAWDRATLPARAARHIVVVYADSFGERALAVDVVENVERLESRVIGDRTCFHAYAGTTEVATAMTITGGTLVPEATNCATGVASEISAQLLR